MRVHHYAPVAAGTGASGARSAGAWTFGQLSEQCSARWPDAVALTDAAVSITFSQLDRCCRRFACELARAGVRAGERVAVLGTKDVQTVIAILAVAKLGASYVPLDPNLPEQRLEFVLRDAGCRAVVGLERLRRVAAGYPFLPSDQNVDERQDTAPFPTPLRPPAAPSDVAYVMYTSGSTGYPKGVMIEHRAIQAFFHAHNASAEITPGSRCMNTGPFHFDVSILDVFLPLYFGASVVLTPELPLPKLLLRTIERHQITHFYAVGTILGLMTGDGSLLDRHDLRSLRMLQTGAEVCNPRTVNQWLRRLPELQFLNSYGPTELTVGCCCFRKPGPGPLPEAEVPIGALHAGSRALLLDQHGATIDGPGEGELLVSGAQLMRGYWNREREQQRAFLERGGEVFYRTGDIVRRDARGTFYYRGRRDHELKIDGLRVHPSEVQRCLDAHPRLRASCVGTLQDSDGRPRLAAALVPRGRFGREQLAGLRADLARELPTQFVPSKYLICSRLPLLPSGKTDSRACMERLAKWRAQSKARAFTWDGDELSTD